MLCMLLTSLLAAPPEWKFVDAPMMGNRSVVTYRSVELANKPTRPLHKDDTPPKDAQFGSVIIGVQSTSRKNLVWDSKTSTVWVDVNNDGRFSTSERHQLESTAPIEITIPIAYGDNMSHERTVLIRKRGEGIAWAVRGYTKGHIVVAGSAYSCMLMDGDADGCFDSASQDRVWIDLNSDNEFNALTEQFVIGQAITVKGVPVLIRPQSDGLGATVRERPSETGTLQVALTKQPLTQVVDMTANYVSEFGELIVVKSTDKSHVLPVGQYRIDSVKLTLANESGKMWSYWFSSNSRKYDITVKRNENTVHQLLAEPRVDVFIDAGGGATPGSSPIVDAVIRSENLYLTHCDRVLDAAESTGINVLAEIKLVEPGSVVVDQCTTGFL